MSLPNGEGSLGHPDMLSESETISEWVRPSASQEMLYTAPSQPQRAADKEYFALNCVCNLRAANVDGPLC